ncbi:MAG: thiamine-phosphate kinase [Deltaproteobacteria bacterium]|nr:thiamine-phosphate kinase [Deltaproteobacteria bacterium]
MMAGERTVGEVGELALLQRLRDRLHRWQPTEPGCLGIGDDAAVIPAAGDDQLVVTTDMLVAGTHFRPGEIVPADLGHKSLAINLSDLAAMGAVPACFFLALGLPPSLPLAWLDEFWEGMFSLAAAADVRLLGGDTVRSAAIVVAVTLHGCTRGAAAVCRTGGRPGDRLYVSGTLGDSALGLEIITRRHGGQPFDERLTMPAAALEDSEDAAFLVRRHCRPEPRLALGRWLAENRVASAMLDLSDGLLIDLDRLLTAGGPELGAELELARLPLSAAYRHLRQPEWPVAGCLPALVGGEDYELLFAVPPAREPVLAAASSRWGVQVSRIGVLTAEPGIRLRLADGRCRPAAGLSGFEHFS